MFVSLRQSKGALIVAGVLTAALLLTLYKMKGAYADIESHYYKLLQQQTAEFVDSQSEEKRLRFIQQHEPLFFSLEQKKTADQLRREVLKRLEKMVANSALIDVKYNFQSVEPLLDIGRDKKILSDSLKLKGIASNMLVFNQAISWLGEGPPYFFELRACDIKRKTDSTLGVQFDCLLSWYSLT